MVLENKLEIINSEKLAQEEERITKKKALELFDKGILKSLGLGTFTKKC